MTEQDSDLLLLIIIWGTVLLGILLFAWRRRAKSVGLVATYALNLSLIHFVGAFVYLSDLPHLYPEKLVIAGFRHSLFGLVAFALGALVLAPAMLSVRRHTDNGTTYEPSEALPRVYITIGILSYLALATFLGEISTLNAIVAVGQQLVLAGLCLMAMRAWQNKNKKRFVMSCVAALLLPFITIVVQGFIGYGSFALLTFVVFLTCVIRPARWKILLVGALTVFVALSVFISYARDRDDLRHLIWGGYGLPDRVERLYATTVDGEWFDPDNQAHLDAIDERLNQNHLVGAAIQKLSATNDFAAGETIVDSIEALVPRALLPDKDIFSGSGDLVSKYTGLEFAEGTSVGIGHILEFYVNFGMLGVLLGMLIIGIVLGLLDRVAYEKLMSGDWQGFLVPFLAGIACLQVGGSLVDLTASVGASILVAIAINKIFRHLQRRRPSGFDLGNMAMGQPAPVRRT